MVIILSIFIFEDDIMQAEYMKRHIETICKAQHIPYQFIHATSRAEDILEKIPHCTYTPLYFLDIEIKQHSRKGLEVAQQIRKHDERGIIVFVTTHSELAPISYQYMVSALTFINKQASKTTVEAQITACLQHYHERNRRSEPEPLFIVENAYTTIKIPFHTVEYIMTDEPHRLQLITTNQLIQFYGTLKEIEAIDARFIRSHKSYLINVEQMKAIDQANQVVILKSGKTVPISRRLYAKLKAKFKEG